jgi:hypothetical protein
VARYQSNLSAVLFEMGEYESCMASVRGAWSTMTDGLLSRIGSDPLATKLATRIAKAAFYSKDLSLFECHHSIDASIRSYFRRHPFSDDEKVLEMQRYWKIFEVKPDLMLAREVPLFKASM